MGCLSLFTENIFKDGKVRCKATQLDLVDNHSVPEIVIGPVDHAHEGQRATFNDWAQFLRFVDAVNDLKFRLEDIKPKVANHHAEKVD